MERIFHKKAELLNFVFKDTDEEYITSSNIYGQNFFYVTSKNQVTISIDLKNSIDINEFTIFFKDLNYFKVDVDYITKQIIKLKELYPHYKYLLELSSSNSIVRKYDLSFSLDKIGLSFKTRYIK